MPVDHNEKYTLHSAKEILALLHGIKHAHVLITAHFDHDKHSMLTAILDVRDSDGTMVLDYGANMRLNRRMLNSGKVLFDTVYNKVKVQFSVHHVVKTLYEKQEAFRGKIPASVLRLQKREYYRADTPIIKPLQCTIPIQNEEQSEDDHSSYDVCEANVVNISVGGVSIVDFPEQVSVTHGMIFSHCRIMLPGVGTLVVDMEVVNVYAVEVKAGGKTRRYGCRFINMDDGLQSMAQRYIIKLDREKINKGAG